MDLLQKNKAKISDLISQVFKLIQERYSTSEQLFTVSSVWGQIVFVLVNITQFILFFIEDSITELNINLATRETSIYGLATLAGHNPTRAISARGEVIISWNGKNKENIGGGAILIPNNSELKCLNNGKKYIIKLPQDNIRLNLDSNSKIIVPIIEGITHTNQYTGNGFKLQSFNISSRGTSNIEHYEIEVKVNGEKWKRYDSLYDMPRNAKGFITRSSLISGIDIFFGTGDFGMVPPSGSIIEVNYIESSGMGGNIINEDTSKIIFNFDSTGKDLFGNIVSLQDVLQVTTSIPPQLGANQESTELTRLLAPKVSRNFVLANPTNYITFFERFGQFSIIEAFTTFNDQYLDDDNIIYLMLVPDVKKTLKSNENYFNIPLSRFLLTESQINRIYQLLDESGQQIVTTVVKIINPVISRYVINIIITIFEGYDPNIIKGKIINLISDYFLNIRRRDKIPRSDLIALIENIEGIDSVSLYFVSEKNEKIKKDNPNLPDIGLDEFGDILMNKDEIVIISGGWSDRNDNYYNYGVDDQKLSSVNIDIKSIIPKTYNIELNNIFKNNLKINNK